jgi:uroporphyrinogen-III decarboxylase
MQECGAHMLSTGDSPAGLLGPELYSSLALPAEQALFRRLDEGGDAFLSLHICGDSTALLSLMAGCGAHVVEIDHRVQPTDAVSAIGDKVALWGNVDPVEILRNGTPDHVAQEAGALLDAVHRGGLRRFVLGSGCILAPDTPPANIHALIGTARSRTPPRGVAGIP